MMLAEQGALPSAVVSETGIATLTDSLDESRIPRRIAQFWNTREAPDDVQRAMESWAANNPEFSYERFDTGTGRDFVLAEQGSSAAEAYDACAHPAMLADYFRLAYLAAKGGVFVDADEWSCLPLKAVFLNCPQKSAFFVRTDRMALFASPLGCAPNYGVIARAFEMATESLLRAKRDGKKLDSWQATGPGVITRAVGEVLLGADGENREQLLKTAAFVHQIDSHKVAREEVFSYKRSASGNWRLQ